MRRFAVRISSLLLCFVVLLSISFAQSTVSGSIAGTVADPTHHSISHAALAVENSDTAERVTAHTDETGHFRVVGLAPGTYTVSVEVAGFASHRLEHVQVEVGRVTELEVRLALEAAKEVVEVQSTAPVVNTVQQDFSHNINLEAIDNLPINGRRWSNFALLTPGATPDGNYGLISFRGISGLLNNSTVDGADNNQAFFSEERGRTRISYVVSQASVREFQVNTSNFSAEYGRAAGAAVNSVTRSGTNNLHGQLFYYIRDNALGATNPFSIAPVKDDTGAWTTEKIKPEDRRQQFGVSIGGPIKKDKLFYFFTWDQQKRNFPGIAAAGIASTFFAQPCVTQSHFNKMSSANQGLVRVCSSDELSTLTKNVMPTGTTDAQAISAFNHGLDYLASMLGEVPRTADQLILFPKIDYKLSNNHTLALSYNRMRWSSPAGVQSAPVVNRGIASFGDDGVKVDTFTARLSSALGSHLSSELRYSWGRDFEFQTAQKPAPGEPLTGPDGFPPSISVASSSSGFTFGMPNTLPRFALPDEHRNQFAESMTWMHGRHLLKFGVDVNRVTDFMNNLYEGGGAYNYNYRDNFIADLYQWQNQTGTSYRGYSTFYKGYGTPAFEFHTWDTAYFVQDDWRVLPRFTVNLGFRYENEMLPEAQIPNPALAGSQKFPSDNNNYGPRVGFAWDLFGDGKTAIRGGYGMYFGRINNSAISSAISNTGVQDAQRTYSFCYKTSSYCSLQGPIFPVVPTVDPFSPTTAGNVVVFAPNMQVPQIHQADLIVERQIAKDTMVSASYLLSLGRELPNFIDTSLDPSSRQNVTYTFDKDYNTGELGPYYMHTLTVPVFTKRLNPAFQAITQISSNVNSSYNALVLQFKRQMHNGLQFRFNYTWSHSLDDNQNSTTFTSTNNTLSPYPFTYTLDNHTHTLTRPDYGNSNFDIRQRFVGSLFWTPRYFRHSDNRVLRLAASNWALSPIVHVSTGRPLDDYVSGNAPISTCGGCTGFMGTGGDTRLPFIGRNSFRYPNLYDVDLRVSRRIYTGERKYIEFMAEGFNLFNHRIVTDVLDRYYSVYNSKLEYDNSFAQPDAAGNTIYRERQVQFAVRYSF